MRRASRRGTLAAGRRVVREVPSGRAGGARPSVIRYVAPTRRSGTPTRLSSNRPIPGRPVRPAIPSFFIIPSTTRFVLVPINVHVPPSVARNAIGISSREGEMRFRRHHEIVSGMNIATTGVLFRKADSGRIAAASRPRPPSRSSPGRAAADRPPPSGRSPAARRHDEQHRRS